MSESIISISFTQKGNHIFTHMQNLERGLFEGEDQWEGKRNGDRE
jgi:hypothetical protein